MPEPGPYFLPSKRTWTFTTFSFSAPYRVRVGVRVRVRVKVWARYKVERYKDVRVDTLDWGTASIWTREEAHLQLSFCTRGRQGHSCPFHDTSDSFGQ